MKKLKVCLLSFAAITASMSSIAQTTFDYAAWGTLQCNAFGNSPTINGHVHRSIYGQPQKNGSYGILMETKYNGNTSPLGTTFDIEYSLLLAHQYQVNIISMCF